MAGAEVFLYGMRDGCLSRSGDGGARFVEMEVEGGELYGREKFVDRDGVIY